jgi:hypothetical protein
MIARTTFLPALALCLAAAACGSDVSEAPDDDNNPDGGGGAGAGGGTGGSSIPQIEVNAPTQDTIAVKFDAAPPEDLLVATGYVVNGERGPVGVHSAALDPATNIVTLATDRQKLGDTLTLDVIGGGVYDGMSDSFLAADTARFWASDLNDPNFNEYELVADRKAVGDHVVVYVEQGETALNVEAAVTFFDSKVLPIETALFTDVPDRDDNGRVLLLGLDGKGAYGGYFYPLNSYTNEEAMQWGVHSNEMEMLYINVEFGFFDNERVVGHEFQHLLYNEAHDLLDDWAWHNEGLGECATHAVNGVNDQDAYYYTQDPQGGIAEGISLINWNYANFDQYVLSYLFLTYVASQVDGVDSYGDLFALNGDPEEVEQFIQNNLGVSFAEAHKNSLVATWVQDATGPYGYNGMVDFNGSPPVGEGPLTLKSFSGAFLQPGTSPVDYPGDQGADIQYVGITGDGTVSTAPPFDVTGGALLVFNASQIVGSSTQGSGNLMPLLPGFTQPRATRLQPARGRELVWLHPPPYHPAKLEHLHRWQAVAHAR